MQAHMGDAKTTEGGVTLGGFSGGALKVVPATLEVFGKRALLVVLCN
jgi:hypothetical protein